LEQSQQMLAAEDTPRYPVDADDNGTAEMDSDEDGSDSNAGYINTARIMAVLCIIRIIV